MSLNDLIERLKADREQMNELAEMLEARSLVTHSQSLGSPMKDTTAEDAMRYRRQIANLDAIIARYEK